MRPTRFRDIPVECSFIFLSFDVQETQPEAEAGAALSPRQRKRKTTQDAHGSFFLRVGAIGKYLMITMWDFSLTFHFTV